MARAVAPGQLAYSVSACAVAGAFGAVGLAGLLSPVVGGVVVGAAATVLLAEAWAASRGGPFGGLVVGALGVAAVVVLADGLVDLALPAIVGGAAAAQAFVASVRYAEHIIAVEGPRRPLAALLRRFTLPASELFLALGGQPLPGSIEAPSSPPRRTSERSS